MSTMSKILTFAFLIAIVVVILATIAAVVLPMLFSKTFPQGVDQWTVAGLTETFAGMMAALLAIIGAAVVAFNWLYLEQRVERVLKEKTDTIKKELFSSLNERIRAMGEFAIIWNYPLEEKDRDSTLDYLEQALQKDPSYKEMIVTDNDYWLVFTSMTRDESQRKKLDTLLKLLELERLSLQDVRNHCIHMNKDEQVRFTAIKKSDGNYALIDIDEVQEGVDDTKNTWRIRASSDFVKSAADLDEVMKIIENVFIPTKLILN